MCLSFGSRQTHLLATGNEIGFGAGRMFLRSKILLIAGVGLLGIFLFVGIVLLEIFCSTPSDAVVKREFLIRYPNMTISNVKLIFEQNGNVVYLITAREGRSIEEGKYDFALQRLNGTWKWCDDRTDNPCGPIAK
jgi:hypothetical protein